MFMSISKQRTDEEDKTILLRAHVDEMIAHAREARPAECCGLIGGRDTSALNVYRLRNVSERPGTSYEAAPEDLFAAQRKMRERGESLIAIYHSHPRSAEPAPSERDVRLAFYPTAVYFIVGFNEEGEGVLSAFRIDETERRWEQVEFSVVEA
jgi:[CysO sulfur-carrier protein]-S-L-cysteine hydrolase